jgi:DNA replication protein DnaC
MADLSPYCSFCFTRPANLIRPYGDDGPAFCSSEHFQSALDKCTVNYRIEGELADNRPQDFSEMLVHARITINKRYESLCASIRFRCESKLPYDWQDWSEREAENHPIVIQHKRMTDKPRHEAEALMASLHEQAKRKCLSDYREKVAKLEREAQEKERGDREYAIRQEASRKSSRELNERMAKRTAELQKRRLELLAVDPKHPMHFCYQCHRPLRKDFGSGSNEFISETGPHFDTARCQEVALNRHRPPGSKGEEEVVDDPTAAILPYNYERHIREIESKPSFILGREYDAFVQRYKEEKTAEDEEEMREEREQQALESESREAYEHMPDSFRSEHTHILGPSGSGKTTLIQHLILKDLAQPNPPSMVIIDPKGLMIERLQSLDVFNPETGRLRDRLVIVDPTHSPPPALNMFHAASKWNRMWSDDQRRRIENQAIGTFGFIFSSTGSALTDKQATPFGYAVRLMFNMESTIHTLIDLMDDPTRTDDAKGQKYSDCKFAPFIGRLDEMSQRFFRNEFFSSNYRETRQQIKARIYGVLQHPEFLRMFEARERRLDILDCLQNRSIVLVNTSMNVMGSDASTLLGRYIISLTLNAAFARFTIPRNEWHQAHLIIDEFQEFADDEKTPELLRLAREYNLAVTLAHQEMHGTGMTDKVRSAVSTNTSIKYASRPEGVDISYVARDMRCDPDFLARQTKTLTEARFACYVRGLTKHPFTLSIPFGNLERERQMSSDAHRRMLEENAARLSSPAERKPPSPRFEDYAPAKPTPQSTPETPKSDRLW